MKATVLCHCLWFLMGALPLVTGCGNGEEEQASAPPAPAQAANQVAKQQAAVEEERKQQAAKAAETVPEPPFDLTYLDAETELFVYARPAAIVASPFVQTLTGGNLGPIDQMKASLGLEIDQIDTVTVGVRKLQKLAAQNPQQRAPAPRGFPVAPQPGVPAMREASEDTIVVIRTVEPTSAEALGFMDPGGNLLPSRTHQKKTYYQISTNGLPEGNLYLADEKTLIIGAEAAIHKIIEQGEEVSPPKVDLSFITAVPEFVLAVVPKNRQSLFRAASGFGVATSPAPMGFPGATPPGFPSGKGSGDPISLSSEDDDHGRGRGRKRDRDRSRPSSAVPPQSNDLNGLLEAHAEAAALLLTVAADLKFDVAVRCDSPQSTAKIKAVLTKTLNTAVQTYENAKAGLPGVIQQVADAVLATRETTSTGETVTLSLTLPESQQSNLTMLPFAVMGMMMGSGAGDVEALVDWKARAKEVIDQGQPPASAEELPSGLELHALARWGVPTSGDGQGAVPLEVAVVATGELAARAIAFGHLELTEANVGEGARLKWLGAAQAESGKAPINGFVPIEREGLFSRHPDGAIATGYTFGAVGGLPANLNAIAGSLTLKSAGNVRDVTVSPLPSFGGSVDDEALRAAGFEVQTETGRGVTTVTVSHQNEPSIGSIEVVGTDGTAMTALGTSTFASGDQVQQSYTFQGNFDRSQLGLRVALFEDVQETPVAFRFADLPLPGEDSREQKPLVNWTSAKTISDDVLEGLRVDAQARWGAPSASPVAMPMASGLPATPQVRPNGSGGGFGRPQDGRSLKGKRADEEAERRRLQPNVRVEDLDEDPPSVVDRPAFGGGIDRPGAGNGGGVAGRGFGGDVPGFGSAFGSGTAAINADGMLQLAVDLTGPQAAKITSVGQLTIEAADSAQGGELEYRGGLYGASAISDDWIDTDSQTATSVDHPPDGVRILALFVPPESPIDSISQLRGSLMVRSAREQIEAVVTNLDERTDRKIKDRNLGKFGIVIAVAVEENQLLFRVLEGKEERIAEMYPVDRDGEKIAGVSHSTTIDNGNLIHVFDFQRSVPSRVGLKFSMNLGVEEFEVPFRFHDVPVPPHPQTLAAQSESP